MIRTINAITIDLGMGATENAKLYAEVDQLLFNLKNGDLSAIGEYFYYEGDTGNAEDKRHYQKISRVYTEAEYNTLYDLLTINSTDKSDQVKEEINEALKYEIVATFPDLGLVIGDFEVV